MTHRLTLPTLTLKYIFQWPKWQTKQIVIFINDITKDYRLRKESNLFIIYYFKCPTDMTDWQIYLIKLIVFILPVFTPPVKIQAPVVTAALIRPFPSNCLILGWSSNFCMPPCTEITSLGNSICHSLSRSCRMISGLVSYDSLTY